MPDAAARLRHFSPRDADYDAIAAITLAADAALYDFHAMLLLPLITLVTAMSAFSLLPFTPLSLRRAY